MVEELTFMSCPLTSARALWPCIPHIYTYNIINIIHFGERGGWTGRTFRRAVRSPCSVYLAAFVTCDHKLDGQFSFVSGP